MGSRRSGFPRDNRRAPEKHNDCGATGESRYNLVTALLGRHCVVAIALRRPVPVWRVEQEAVWYNHSNVCSVQRVKTGMCFTEFDTLASISCLVLYTLIMICPAR